MIHKLLFTIFLFSSILASGQNCNGIFLIDSLDDHTLWTSAGLRLTPGSANPPGDLRVNSTQKRIQFSAFKARQTYRIQRPLGCKLDSNDQWTAEFQFINNATAFNEYAALFILTEDTTHWMSDVPASSLSDYNKNDAIAFVLKDSSKLSGQLQAMQAFIVSKKDSILNNQQSVAIDIARGVNFYARVQRINTSTISLSVFDDSLRTNHLVNSPLLVQIDSSIGNLRYLQLATLSGPTGFRSSNIFTYNYKIYKGFPTGQLSFENDHQRPFQLAPNPASDFVRIKSSSNLSYSVRLISSMGIELRFTENSDGSESQFDLQGLDQGLYFLEIRSGNERVVEKLIIN